MIQGYNFDVADSVEIKAPHDREGCHGIVVDMFRNHTYKVRILDARREEWIIPESQLRHSGRVNIRRDDHEPIT